MTLLQDESTDEDGAKERYQSSCGAKRSGRSASTSRDRRGSRRRASGTARRADRAARGALRRGRSRLGHTGRAVPVVAVGLAATRGHRVAVARRSGLLGRRRRRLGDTRRAVPVVAVRLTAARHLGVAAGRGGRLRRGRGRLRHAGRAVPVVAVRLAAARRLRVVVVVSRRLSSTRRGRVAVPLTISQVADMTRKNTGRVLQWSPCGSQAPEPVGEGGSDWDSEAAWGEAATRAAWPRRTSESHDWGCILTGLVQRRTKGLC